MNAQVLLLDNTEARLVIKRQLKDLGILTLLAKTNQQAIKVLDAHLDTVQCIIVDPYLLHNSANEFLYEMRSYQDMRDIKIIVYSSNQIPKRVLESIDWKLLKIDKVFYKSKHSITEVCELALALTRSHSV